MDEAKRAQTIFRLLKQEYPEVKGTELHYRSHLQLLIATILSAQTTDKQVNDVIGPLFRRYKTAKDYAEADFEELQELIRPTGFFRRKSQLIKAAAKKLVDDFHSKVPHTMEELIQLPGVARKTANIVLSNAFGVIEGVAVDTHVMRLAQRMGLTKQKIREKIERDLMNLFSRKQWFPLSNLLIAHGRNICYARNPQCSECVVNQLCPSAFTFK